MKGQAQKQASVELLKIQPKRTNFLRWLFVLTGWIWGGVYSQPGWAAVLKCKPNTQSITLSIGDIAVQKDVAHLSALTPEVLSSPTGFDCRGSTTSGGGVKVYGISSGIKIDSANIYKTNINGVGYAIGGEGPYKGWIGSITSGVLGGPDWILTNAAYFGQYFNSLSAKLRLYKTGPLKSGKLEGKVGALFSNTGPAPETIWGPEIPIYISGTVRVISCSLASTSINVPLGDVVTSRFTGVGTTAGEKTFNVGLSCEKDAKINVSLSGNQNIDIPDTSVLALTNAGQVGTAAGIGVQLLYGGSPLKINEKILLKTSSGGQETLPFIARYFQTKTTVGAGLANSSATLNITYQ